MAWSVSSSLISCTSAILSPVEGLNTGKVLPLAAETQLPPTHPLLLNRERDLAAICCCTHYTVGVYTFTGLFY